MSSVFARAVVPLPAAWRLPARKPRASGLHGITPTPFFAAERQHLALLLAIDQVVVVLHRHEPRPPVPIREVERLGELPGPHARRADVARLAGAHDVVERQERFLDRRLGIPAMDLIEVHVVGPETAQRAVDGGHQVFPREPAIVRIVGHRVERLGGEDRMVARAEVLHRAAEDLFRDAERVHVGGIEEVDALLERPLEKRAAGLFSEHPAAPGRIAVGHDAEAEPRDFQAGAAKIHVLHAGDVTASQGSCQLPAPSFQLPASSFQLPARPDGTRRAEGTA